jgi:UDP-N-acetylglucosamine 2-epimerase (non-hydrolysing)
MRIIVVAGARPNFMKVAPVIKELSSVRETETVIVHTGQHYDKEMSKNFFKDLEIPRPHLFLGVGSGSHAEQTAKIMISFEEVLLQKKAELVIVVGDVKSTLACALVAVKHGVKIAHIEAGLRSFDKSMPEEINRIVTDAISDFLFVTEESAILNLSREGVPKEKIFFVGNVMIDTLLQYREKARHSDILNKIGLNSTSNSVLDYAVFTLHRPSNVDDKGKFMEIIDAVREISEAVPVVFPAHPRTMKHIKDFGYEEYFKISEDSLSYKVAERGIHCIGPLGYLDFLHLTSLAKLVLTDSGGVQEETTILGVPCVTIRENTERPITVTHGTNRIAGTEKLSIINESFDALRNRNAKTAIPPLWDGNAAKRVIAILLEIFNHSDGNIREMA